MPDSDGIAPDVACSPQIDDLAVTVRLPDTSTGTSWYSAVFITVNAGLGAALLAFPQAFDMAGGITISVIALVVIGFIALGSMVILAYCSDVTDTATYQGTVQQCCGQAVNVLCSLAIAIYSFGCCITYLILIGDQWDKVFDFAISDPAARRMWYVDRRFITSLTSVVIILPLTVPRRIEFLRYASALGVVGICYIGTLVIAEYFSDLPPPGPVKTRPDSWTDVFMVLPTICFGYQAHVTVVPIYASMRGRSKLRLFAVTASLAILSFLLIYIAIGVFGYLSFGNRISADVLVDYPPRPEVIVGVALLAIKTYTTYPIMQLCGRSALESCVLWLSGWSSERWVRSETFFHYGCNLAWFVSSLLLTIFVPDISIVIGLLGGLACLFIFVFPGVCLLKLVLGDSSEKLPKRSIMALACACFYTGFGAFVFGLTTTQSIQYIVHRYQQPSFNSPFSNPSGFEKSEKVVIQSSTDLFTVLNGGRTG